MAESWDAEEDFVRRAQAGQQHCGSRSLDGRAWVMLLLAVRFGLERRQDAPSSVGGGGEL